MQAMPLLPLFQWFEATAVGTAVSKSTYLFPSIEVVHLLGLTLLLGAVLVINMRLLGLGMRRQSVPQVSEAMTPLFWTGVGTAILTGAVLFLAEAVKCYFNVAFAYKMTLLALALLFHITIHRKVRMSAAPSSAAAASVAIISLVLWFGVGIAGRWIGFI